jgi:hypothetical protein
MFDEDSLTFPCGFFPLTCSAPVARPGIGNGDGFFDFFAIRYRVFAFGYLGKSISGNSWSLVEGDVANITKFGSAFFAGFGAKVDVKGFAVLEGPGLQPGKLVVRRISSGMVERIIDIIHCFLAVAHWSQHIMHYDA